MKIFFLFLFVLSLQMAYGQFRTIPVRTKYELALPAKPAKVAWSPFGILADQQQTYKFSSPSMGWLSDQAIHSASPVWVNMVSSQSYNNGRFGTYYYWDMQGNLQGTRGFIDLSGGKKRGVKLLFPWR